MSCQICFDTPDPVEMELVTSICRRKCEGLVCQACLERHIEVSLSNFYAGFLPKIRCPICMTFMHKSWWKKHLREPARETLVKEFEDLCKKACAFLPPCCHNEDYTHLPEFNSDARFQSWASLNVSPKIIQTLRRYEREFCRYKRDARSIINYVMTHFNLTNVWEQCRVIDWMVERIHDDERRATLRLSYLYVRPFTSTLCCDEPICFNCKRTNYHDKCDEEYGDQDISVSTDVVQCRSCRALLVKVEGCEDVTCLCGFKMNWNCELEYRAGHLQERIPIDIFDVAMFNLWKADRMIRLDVHKQLRDNYFTKREARFKIWFKRQNRPYFRESFTKFVRRRRYNKVMNSLTRFMADRAQVAEAMEELFAMDL